jgi:hypothetical protein
MRCVWADLLDDYPPQPPIEPKEALFAFRAGIVAMGIAAVVIAAVIAIFYWPV